MKRERNRGYRRQQRERAIQHAFDIFWYQWSEYKSSFKGRGYYNYQRIILDHNNARWYYENLHRQHIIDWAKQSADNMCTCSCYLCTAHRKYKTIHERREIERDKCDAAEIFDEDM